MNTEPTATLAAPEVSRFRVYYSVFNTNHIPIGSAKLIGNTVKFEALEEAHQWYELRPDSYLREVRSVVRRLVRSVGHWSKFSSSWDENHGIGVQRL